MKAMPPAMDPQIRAALIARLRESDPTAVIHEELPLVRGEGRADVVWVNGVLEGYEIKSERDSLSRLSTQIGQYETIFEYNSLVVAPAHLKGVRSRAPKSWGLLVAENHGGAVRIEPVRKARKNGKVDRDALIRVLWKHECVAVLKRHGIPARPTEMIIDLWAKMGSLSTRALREAVKAELKSRRGSESGSP